MVVSSIVLMIDGDGRHGGSGGASDSLQICPALFSHLSIPEPQETKCMWIHQFLPTLQ